MVTLYEVLEVSEKASDEIIEKAYKTLAKKYHPDLQPPENKKTAEVKMKQINEAYDTLSDKAKRAEYDAGLAKIRAAEEMSKQNIVMPNYQNQAEVQQTRVVYTTNPNVKPTNNINYNEVRKQYEKEQFRIKLMSIRDGCIATLVILIILGILWILPPSREWMINFYEDNIIVKTIVDVLLSMFGYDV